MNMYRAMLCSVALATATTAAERPHHLAALLSDAPADVLAVIYVQTPADVINHPLRLWLLKEQATRPVMEAADALAKLLDGPTAVIVTGSPLRPDLLAVTIMAKVSKDAETFHTSLDDELLAALNRIEAFPGAGAIGFDRSGELSTLRIPSRVPFHMTFAVRDGYVRASTNRGVVEAWLSPLAGNPDEQAKTFLSSDDFKRLVPDAARAPELLVYVNGRSLMPMAKLALRHVPELYYILGLEQIEAAGLTGSWSGKRTEAAVTLCLSGEPTGVLRFARANDGPVNVARVFPADTVFTLGGKFDTAAAVADQVNEILNRVDPDIVREYEQERAEFMRDFGFDIQADFLGNLVDEWAVAVRAGGGGLPEFMIAVGLDEPAVFDGHVRALTAAFDLGFDVTTYRGVAIFSPLSARLHVAYGVVDRYLAIGPDVAAVSRMVDAWQDHAALHGAPGYRALAARLARGTSGFAYLDVSQVVTLALRNDELTVDPDLGINEAMVEGLESLASADASAALALRSAPGSIRLSFELAGGDASRKVAGEAFWLSLGASLARSRELSKRIVSAANLKSIVQSALIYANAHKGEWPASLAELVRAGYVSLNTLGNVYEGTAPRTLADADREAYYLYRSDIPKGIAATEVVAGERAIRSGEGANFAFADGHVEFIREPTAGRLLARLRANGR